MIFVPILRKYLISQPRRNLMNLFTAVKLDKQPSANNIGFSYYDPA
jgi:hypothetical protein